MMTSARYLLLLALIGLSACGPNKKPDEVVGKPPEAEPEYQLRVKKSIPIYTAGQPKDAQEHQRMVDQALNDRAQALGACLGDPNSEFHGETLAMRVRFELSWRGEMSQLDLGALPVGKEDPLVPCLVDVLQTTTMPYHPDKISTTHRLQIKVNR